MTAVTSKMSRMVLLYTLILCMVSLPTSLPRHLLVETADKGGDDYGHCDCFLCCWDYSKGQQNEGKLFIIPWSFIPIFRHSRQSRHFMTLFWCVIKEIWYIGAIIKWQITINYWTKLSPNHFTFLTESACHNQLGDIWQYRDQYEYQFKMYAFVHQCCCLALIYKPKGARPTTR